MLCHWSVYFSLQDQNKLTNDRTYAALPHLDYRHGVRRTGAIPTTNPFLDTLC